VSVHDRDPIAAPRVIAGDDPDAVGLVAQALRAGRIVAMPTDTVYGLAAAIDKPAAIERLYVLKGRPKDKPIPILLSDRTQIAKVAETLPWIAELLARAFWPGALTLVVPADSRLLPLLTSYSGEGERTVALRVPDHTQAREIIAAAGGALAVTSANLAGEEPARAAHEILQARGLRPDIVFDGGHVPGGVASTIVVATGSTPAILRQGAITEVQITGVLRGRVDQGRITY
jgi:L-threonylcarbamoyladenylate synthase